jgi:hypothetical protein
MRCQGESADWRNSTTRTSVPFSDELPVTATAGQPYEIRAIMHATGTGTNATATGTDEWVATGIGTP